MTKESLPDINAYYQALEKRLSTGAPCSVLQIDVMFLRGINRTFGREAGDLLLQTATERLCAYFADIPVYLTREVRYYVITDPADHEIVSALQKYLSMPVPFGDIQLIPGIRVVYVNAKEGDDYTVLSSLLQHASGKQELLKMRVVEADDTLRRESEESGYLMEELRYAIEHQTFEINYQPVYDLSAERFVSAEALCRLKDRNGRPIYPDRFFPFAENRYLIDPITEIVIRKVCAFLGSHADLPIHSVSINLTPAQIRDPNLPARLRETAESFGISTDRLRLEMTERSVQEDSDSVRAVMQELNEMGSGFYLDDFGSGYSNITSVMSLPFEAIKFDKSIADRLESGTPEVSGMIALLGRLVHTGHKIVVFEGIESDAQDRFCRENGFDRIQGYRYSRPLPEEDFTAFLTSRNSEESR